MWLNRRKEGDPVGAQRSTVDRSKPPGLIWIDCPYPVVAIGLERILEARARVHLGSKAPSEEPSFAIFDAEGTQSLSEGVKRIREVRPEIPILVFSLRMDLPLAWSALQAGARGFIHAGMPPDQVVRAVEIAAKGEIVAPRKLLEYLVAAEDSEEDLDALSTRQREIMELLAEGLSNTQIADRLYLSESTVKQHLRHAYKLLGVKNRIEAAKLLRKKT